MGPPRGQSLCSESVVCEGGKIQSLHFMCSQARKEELITWWVMFISLCRWVENSLCTTPLNRVSQFSLAGFLPQNKKGSARLSGMARMEVVETVVFPISLSPHLQGECPYKHTAKTVTLVPFQS